MRYNEIATYAGLAVSYVCSQRVVSKLQNSPDSTLYFLGIMCHLIPMTSFLNSIYDYNADKRDNQGNKFHKTLMPPLGSFLYSLFYGSSKQVYDLFLAAATTLIIAVPLSANKTDSALYIIMPILFNLMAVENCKFFTSLFGNRAEEAPQR